MIPKIYSIIKNKKAYFYFDTYNDIKDAKETAYDYKKTYEGSKHIIVPFYVDKPNAQKQFALYMTKVIKVLR